MIPYKKLRSSMEMFYEDRMTVTTSFGTRKDSETFETVPDIKVIYKDEPCRLSYDFGGSNHNESEYYDKGEQKVKLFTAPDIDIPQGSKIEIKRQGFVLVFGKSDEPYRYGSHCEYMLTNWENTR